jgi:outer membrane receptor protein involved in Fe transport
VYATTVIGHRALTAASDQVVRDRDFLLFPRQTPSDLLLMVPQLHISQHSGSGKGHQIFLRGFDAEHGQDLYIGFDGVPINEPSHIHGIGYTDLHFIIPELVKRIQILKGPYDVRYGAFATAGAINFVLKDCLPRSYVDVSGGSFATLQGTLAFSPDLKSLDMVVAVQGFSTEGFTFFGDWKGVRSLARLSKRLGGGRLALTLVAYASLWNAADAVPERLVDSGALDFYGGLDESDGGSSQRQHLALSYHKDWGPSSLRASVFLAQRMTRIFTNYTYLLDHPDHGDQTEQADQRWILGGRAEWEREHRWRRLKVTTLAGAVFRSDWVDVALYRTQGRQRWDRGAEVSVRLLDVGAYARVEVAPVRWFRALAGLRYDHLAYDVTGVQDLVRPSGAIDHDQPVNGTAGRNVFAPKASLIFSPVKKLDLFVNFGTGFHPLDARDAAANPRQQIPLAYAGELGFRARLWNRLDLAGSAWATYLEQEIFFDPTLGCSVDTGRSRRLGGEVEARLRIWSWLHLHLDGSYTDARLVDSGYPVPNSPNLLIRGGMTVYKRFHSRVRFFAGSLLRTGLRVRYIGARDLADGHRSEDATLVDLLVGYKLRWFALEVSVENLLNQRWRDAQYHYVSRASLSEPDTGVAGHHFTAGTPFAVRATLRVFLP